MKQRSGDLRKRAQDILERMVAAARRLAQVDATFDPASLNGGASAAEIAAVEKHLGRSLPPMLRTVLSISNGAPNLFVFGDLLSTTEMLPGSAAHQRLTELQRTMEGEHWGGEYHESPVVPAGVLGISDRHGDQPDCTYLDPSETTPDGEWAVVEHDHESGDIRFADLGAYVDHVLEMMNMFIAEAETPRAPTALQEPTDEPDRPLLLGPDGRPLRRT